MSTSATSSGVTGEVITSSAGSCLSSRRTSPSRPSASCPRQTNTKGLNDPEARVRQRYVDLIVNHDARDMLAMRSEMVRAIREQLWSRNYLEVETPMMQRVHGGANARPFVTHINAYDMRLYMRIAPELFLKRLLVGGVERVFELNRNFRNGAPTPLTTPSSRAWRCTTHTATTTPCGPHSRPDPCCRDRGAWGADCETPHCGRV